MEVRLKDVQNCIDTRHIPLDKVGVKDISYPIILLDKYYKKQSTIASISMYVNLPHHFKGTHMSRFIEILNEYHKEFHIQKIPHMLKRIKKTFQAQNAHLDLTFPYFILKKAPVTHAEGLLEYQCTCTASLIGKKLDFIIGVAVPLMTLCPCSKEISAYGAHNQRGIARVAIRYKRMVWFEDLIALIEACGSSPLYSVLKRPDEKYVTEHAFDHPRFVEDLVREIALTLKQNKHITWYRIEGETFESIHKHSAYASVEVPQRA